MSNPAQVGRNEWKAALKEAREANLEMRGLLKRILRESAQPLTQALAGQAALIVMDNDHALDRLDEIGRNTERREQK